MNRLFKTLREFVTQQPASTPAPDALPGFENRIEVLCRHAENAAHYEDDLIKARDEVQASIALFEGGVEDALDAGNDRDALEYVRLMVRLRPQIELLNHEIENFHAVASALILKTNLLMQNMDEARAFARQDALNPAATHYLDQTLDKLTRYFIMLDRVAAKRRTGLPDRLAQLMLRVMDDRKLDLELATYILARRRAIGSGR